MSANNTNITSLETCLNSLELFRGVCKYFGYEQQYKLLQVSNVLNRIITNHIWNIKFNVVNIKIFSENDFIVTDIIDANEISEFIDEYNMLARSAVHLNADNMKKFLNLNKNNVEKLQIVSQTKRYERFILQPCFKNLKYLSYKSIEITNLELKHVADNCRNIETLHLSECLTDDGRNPVLANDSGLQILEHMPSLKNLKVTDYCTLGYKFSNIVTIINRLNLQELVLYCFIDEYNSAEKCHLNVTKIRKYKHFKTDCMGDRLYFQRNFIRNFKNLTNLYLRNRDIANDFFIVLRNSCRNLTHLSLDSCEIENFTALYNLRELYLIECTGLISPDLRTILNQMNLKCFTAINTAFIGDFETFSVSPNLEDLKITNAGKNITKLFDINSNTEFMKLTKFYFVTCKMLQFSIKLAPKLQDLCIPLHLINIKNFLELGYLQKVIVTYCCSNEMSKLQQLLQHEYLKELSILYYDFVANDPDVKDNQIDAVRTKLLYFNIPEDMIKFELDFVLDLLNVNENLSLKCALASISQIRKMLLNGKFPKRFKSINICGFLMDCASILNGSAETKEPLKYFEDKYFILE